MIPEVEESRMTQDAVSVGRKGSSGKQQRECSPIKQYKKSTGSGLTDHLEK